MNSSRVNPRYQHFFDVNNTKAILSELNEMRKQKILIDAEIQVESQQFACHRAVLASCSDYFKAMFTNEMNEKHCHHITLNQISADIFESLIEFIYTAQLVLLPDDMQDMLTTVNYFQIHLEKLAETCTSSLLGKLSPSTCLQALNMSVALLSPSLDQAAIQLAVTNFSKVYMTKQFLELSKDHLIKIISDDNLNINEEDTVLHAAVKWINYDKKMRVALINDVMKCVRFPFVNKNYLHEMILSESHIMTSPIVRKCIEESNKPPLESDSQDNTQRYRARDKLTKEVIVMIGSESLCGPSLSVESYSVSTGSWNSLPCLVTGIVPVTVVTLDNDIYVMGYCSDVGLPEVTSQLWKYSSVTNSWSQKPSMKVKRWNYAACVLSGMIYCIGGLSVGKYSMDEVEVMIQSLIPGKMESPC
ncbi:kelch-like protein 21 [Ptychodera flava]|uniref:kelch-like protein 21 n=1 Tax=Ptychodera flava TaxID=63121 RepID=UPI00396A2322